MRLRRRPPGYRYLLGTRTERIVARARRARLGALSRGRVQMGRGVYLGPGFRLALPAGASVVLGDGVQFRRDCVIEMEYESVLEVGAGTVFTYGVVIQVTREVRIGQRCLFAVGSTVVDSKHTFREPAYRELDFAPVTIGDGVWVSSKATVAAHVGERAVVAANAAVMRPVAPWSLAGGVPAEELERFGPPG